MRFTPGETKWGIGRVGWRCILDEVTTECLVSVQRHPRTRKL